jgi:hypothetical protein
LDVSGTKKSPHRSGDVEISATAPWGWAGETAVPLRQQQNGGLGNFIALARMKKPPSFRVGWPLLSPTVVRAAFCPAILAADVAGYSRLMGADEEGTRERLKGHLVLRTIQMNQLTPPPGFPGESRDPLLP